MAPLEIVLVTLVSVWTVLFCLLGIAGWYVVRDLRRILGRVDQLLKSTQGLTEDVRAPFAALATAIREVFTVGLKPSGDRRAKESERVPEKRDNPQDREGTDLPGRRPDGA